MPSSLLCLGIKDYRNRAECNSYSNIYFMKYMKAIIFDLAGVILNLNLERDTRALNDVGLPDFAGCLADDAIRIPMLAYLNGLSDVETFCHDLRPKCRPDVTDAEMLWAMDAVLDDIPRSRIDMLLSLRKNYRVFLLSNIYDAAWKHAVKEIEHHGVSVSDCFDYTFLSHEMQLAKPDPKIFQAVIDATGINPEETYYFDDTKENIDMGAKLGFHSILVPMNQLESVIDVL